MQKSEIRNNLFDFPLKKLFGFYFRKLSRFIYVNPWQSCPTYNTTAIAHSAYNKTDPRFAKLSYFKRLPFGSLDNFINPSNPDVLRCSGDTYSIRPFNIFLYSKCNPFKVDDFDTDQKKT